MSSPSSHTILCISTPSQIASCLATYQELRPHLIDEQQFVLQIEHQQKQDGFRLNAISIGDEIVALVGYRIMTTTAWGKIVYIDDLVCKESHRGKGLGSQLLHFVDNFAKENGCKQVHLDSGYQRNAAHKVYLNNGYILGCHHFIKTLN
ncbi:GCN5-related N-acetyltransferase [Naegleria gruberi]|uniref:GCN5-related N-acetyltransferase n=1 Tax=Naegleria gruberi TaxID=5762 RepID=D2V7A4_NAEGR|nr:GCN5-related N-acetyltransferase [Naegleria gruberi]EFC47340.1 GCN5-related N-acetyltransferase [Naegleria gruberi]|eukprot:XP_002680084.1 GCN5-related N-acetyltransferase [Naegleria gruberi strain NEG-M]